MKFIVAILMSFWILSGCQTLKPAVPTGLKPAAFWKDQELRLASLKNLSGKLGLRFKGEKQNVAGKGKFLVKFPEGYFLEIRDPFGRLHFRLLGWLPSVVAEYPREKLAYQDGQSGRAYLKRVLGVDLTLEDLVKLWWGAVPLKVAQLKDAQWEWENDGTYRLSGEKSGKSTKIWVDGTTAAIRKLELPIESGTIEVSYDDFDKEGATVLAHQVGMGDTHSSSRIELEWIEIDSLKTPPSKSQFDWQSSPDLQVIRLK